MNTKQTEIGEIPKDWEVVKLGEITEIKKGDLITTANIRHGDIPVIAGGKKPAYYHDAANRFGKTITISASGANAGFVSFHCCDIFASDCSTISENQQYSIEFIYFTLLNKQSEIYKLQTGGAQPHIHPKDLNPLLIPLPPFPEQAAIAAILSDTDRLLAALRALIGKKRAVKTAAMQQLLSGRLRLPGFAATGRLKNSELGEIPEDWEVVKIKEFTDCTAGGTPSTVISEYWNGGIPWMNSGELHLKQVYDVSGRITELGLNNSSTSVVPKNSVLIGLAGQGKTRGTVAISRIPLCTNQSIAAVFPNNLFCSEYLFYNLENRYEELRSLSTGDGGRGGLNLTIIRNLAVPFPSHPEQTAIAQTLSDMDSEIAALEARAAKLAHIKQGLMQNLLTGKIRVNTGAA